MLNNPPDFEEKSWIIRAQRGDGFAFSKIIEKYQQPVYHLCYRKLADVTEAEDAAQEIFIRVYSKLNTYDETRGKFSTWLFSIAGHYCIDRLRLRRHRVILWNDLPPWSRLPVGETFQPEKVLLEAETSQQARNLLKILPPDYRTAIILKYWRSRSDQEIAQMQDTTVSAIKSKLFRARRMMAQVAA